MQSQALPRRVLGWAALLACVALLSAGCGKSVGGRQLGGESHFLGNCAQGCGALSCIAGVCTLPCAEASACGDLNAQAVCRIEAGETSGFCDLTCSGEAACPGGRELSCQAGYCRSESSPEAESTIDAGTESVRSSPRTASGFLSMCLDSTTLTGDVAFANPDDLEGCEEITGRVQIGDLNATADDVIDLRPLHALKRVGGSLELRGHVSSFEGLEQLESLGGLGLANFTVDGVPDLPQLRQLGWLDLRQTNLTDLSAFRHATGITRLNLEDNQVLKTLDGLASAQLRAVGLYRNSALTDLGALSGLVSVDELAIAVLPIQNLDALSGVQSIGRLSLGGLPQLRNIDALAKLESLGGLLIDDCSQLSHLPDFSRLTELAELRLSSNPQLELGSSFSALRRLTAYTAIDDDGIVGRAEFPRLETVSGLQISANTGLSELQLPVLRECEYLTVQNSPQLTALQLSAFARGTIDIERNERLSSVDLPLLASQPGDLSTLVIALNPALEPGAIQIGQAQAWQLERVGGNAGVAVAGSALQLQQLDPCPWEGDGVCDACPLVGVVGIGISCPFWLCASGTDTTDCDSPDAGP